MWRERAREDVGDALARAASIPRVASGFRGEIDRDSRNANELAEDAGNRYHEFMKKRSRKSPTPIGRVAEPVQVYLARPDRERLERLARKLASTKSDVLRQGLLALESQLKASPTEGNLEPLPTFKGGRVLPGVNLDSSAALLDLMDGFDAPGNDAPS